MQVPKGLGNFTSAELLAELHKRGEDKKKPPEPKQVIDWSPVRKAAEQHIAELAEKGYVDEDSAHYIFEDVITAVYGEQIWPWYREMQG